MWLADVDWSKLHRALIVLAICFGISAGLVGSSYIFWSTKALEHRQAKSDLQRIRGTYATIDQEDRIIEIFLQPFRTRIEDGYISALDGGAKVSRMQWNEALTRTKDALKLPGMRFTIQKEVKYVPEFPVPGGSFTPHTTDIRMSAKLLHEGDLIKFFEVLDQRVPGLYTVAACRLLRDNPTVLVTNMREGNLDSECRIQWLMVKAPTT